MRFLLCSIANYVTYPRRYLRPVYLGNRGFSCYATIQITWHVKGIFKSIFNYITHEDVCEKRCTHTNARKHAHTDIYIYIYIYIQFRIIPHTHTHTHSHTHARAHIYIYIYILKFPEVSFDICTLDNILNC